MNKNIIKNITNKSFNNKNKINNIKYIKIDPKYIHNEYIKGGNLLLNEINDNYDLFVNNTYKDYIIGKDNYKKYIKDCIMNYIKLEKIFSSYDNEDHEDELLILDNDNYKIIVYYTYLMLFNYKLTDNDFNNYNVNNINENIINYRIDNIMCGLEDMVDRKLKFSNIINIIFNCGITLLNTNNMINYELIYLCNKIINNKNNQELINKLINKLKIFNTQNEKEIKFVLNNFYDKYEDDSDLSESRDADISTSSKFYNDDFKLKYISQLNIYVLYYLYSINISNELSNKIKLFLNL